MSIRVGDALAELERMPLVSIDRVVGPGTVVILAPHPDDESIGCGGLIAAACARGLHVAVVVLTDGSASHRQSQAYPPHRLAAVRQGEVRGALDVLGANAAVLQFLDCRDAAAPMSGPTFDASVEALIAIVDRTGADTLFCTWEQDPHCDHVAAAAMADAVVAARPGLRSWRYPVWGLHRPANDIIDGPLPRGVRLDIRPWLAAKRAAIDCHASQLGRVVDDDPTGFKLTPDMLAPFLSGVERFIGTGR